MTTEQILDLSFALLIMCVGLAGSILPGIPGTPLVLITAISILVDYLAGMYGAKELGDTWRGVLGAVVFEMAGGRKFKDAGRAGLGATPGLLSGAVAKLGCCVAMMGVFAFDVIRRCLNQISI